MFQITGEAGETQRTKVDISLALNIDNSLKCWMALHHGTMLVSAHHRTKRESDSAARIMRICGELSRETSSELLTCMSQWGAVYCVQSSLLYVTKTSRSLCIKIIYTEVFSFIDMSLTHIFLTFRDLHIVVDQSSPSFSSTVCLQSCQLSVPVCSNLLGCCQSISV